MSQRGVILPGDLPPLAETAKPGNATSIDSDWSTLDELQRRYIERVLDHARQNKTSAASILGVDRRTIQRFASREAGKDDDSR
jgi:transcriptional regulator with GAF, ATPase, and Fis domain